MAYAKQCCGLAYRQTEGLFRTYDLPCVPDYTLLQKLITSMKNKNIVIAIDGTDKITNREARQMQISKYMMESIRNNKLFENTYLKFLEIINTGYLEKYMLAVCSH